MEYRQPNRLLTAVVAVSAAMVLAACSSGGESPEETTSQTVVQTTSSTRTTEASTSPPPTTTTASTTSTTSSTSTTTTTTTDGVEPVAERFASLAPAELFEQFESCTSTGLEGTYECSGPEVGQFQFFDSHSKAASTTQVLTELRSSRVVEDTGSRTVGWSTLGTTAVITVVDNDEGLVAQQLVSSDTEDPERKIYKLGLATPPAAPSPTAPSAEPTAEK